MWGLLLILFSTTSALVFKCKYTCRFTLNTCRATVIDYDNPTVLTEVRGNDTSRNKYLKRLEVYDQESLTHFPKNIEKFFLNLKYIDFNNDTLMFITAKDLQPFPNVKHFIFMNNKLTSLDGDLFKYTRELTFLNFANNPISHVGYGLLDGLTELKTANFESCQCINFVGQCDKNTLKVLKKELRSKCGQLATTSPATKDMSKKIIGGC